MKTLRKCRVCGLEATTEVQLESFVRDSKSKYNRANCCLECRRKEYNSYDEENREERAIKGLDNYHNIRWGKTLATKYGINEEIYNEMYNEQNGCCKICGTHTSHLSERLAVDHCHSTGKVRGLLCRFCNLMIGNAYDDTNILKNAIKYLEENN